MRFAQRGKGNAFFGPKHAAHPINAMLNYCYVVEAGRLAKALAAQGLALPIGYFHSDRKGRNSLVWDTIEPLRPAIDAKVFAFVEAHEFARLRFPSIGVQRASPFPRCDAAPVAQGVAVVARDRGSGGVDGWGDYPQAKINAVGRRRGRPARKGAFSYRLGGLRFACCAA